MLGTHRIVIQSKKIRYDFEINRNITVITGDSATGKTTLVSMIRDYYELGVNSGINVVCDKTCVVLEGRDWEERLINIKDSIVFIDEGSKFVTSNHFASAVKHSDNYYVIITREKLSGLPYSVNEIYGIKNSGKYEKTAAIYNEMYRLYSSGTYIDKVPSRIIVEDSNSGYEFFELVTSKMGIECQSAKGKSNIINQIKESNEQMVLIIADGAAYGSEMQETMQYLNRYHNYVLYLPESFEWLILKSGLFHSKKIAGILENPGDYIESEKYFSWERYFTALLTEEADKKEGWGYSKERLYACYKQMPAVKKILSVIEKVTFLWRRV